MSERNSWNNIQKYLRQHLAYSRCLANNININIYGSFKLVYYTKITNSISRITNLEMKKINAEINAGCLL